MRVIFDELMIERYLYEFNLIEYAGHAREYVQTIQLNDWNGIVLASGDGLVYEVNNFIFCLKVLFFL